MNPLVLDKGASVLIPAAVPGYTIQGKGVIYRAAVPIEPKQRAHRKLARNPLRQSIFQNKVLRMRAPNIMRLISSR